LEADGKRSEVIPAVDRREHLPRGSILRGRKNFTRLFRHGKRIEGSLLSCLTATLPDEFGKKEKYFFAVIVQRRTGSAVRRNKIKRWVREAYRRNKKFLIESASRNENPIAVLFSYRRHDTEKDIRYADVERDVQSILEKIISIKEWN
jgi:ribonuclease P protein component